jgi:hypothetical protein
MTRYFYHKDYTLWFIVPYNFGITLTTVIIDITNTTKLVRVADHAAASRCWWHEDDEQCTMDSRPYRRATARFVRGGTLPLYRTQSVRSGARRNQEVCGMDNDGEGCQRLCAEFVIELSRRDSPKWHMRLAVDHMNCHPKTLFFGTVLRSVFSASAVGFCVIYSMRLSHELRDFSIPAPARVFPCRLTFI